MVALIATTAVATTTLEPEAREHWEISPRPVDWFFAANRRFSLFRGVPMNGSSKLSARHAFRRPRVLVLLHLTAVLICAAGRPVGARAPPGLFDTTGEPAPHARGWRRRAAGRR